MSRLTGPLTFLLLLTLVIVIPGCNGSDDEATQSDIQSTIEPTAAPEPIEDVTLTIGNLTDVTGPASTAMEVIDTALDDLVNYFNEENIIPGVELKVITYDGQFDPSKDIPGYERLREEGADFVFSAVPGTPVTLKTRADKDQVMIFGVSGDPEELTPPGYVFNLGTLPRQEGLTLLKWIAENDWDYETKGPAKIGGASWNDAYSGWWLDAMKDYAEAHPDQYDWVSGHLTSLGTFTWGPEVEALRDCDYLFVPGIMTNFVKEYRGAGYTGTFIGTYTHAAFFGQISDAGLWDEIDGMLLMASSRWWNEEGEIIDLTKKLLYENHPDSAEEIIRSGVGYIATVNLIQMLRMIENAVKTVGAQSFDSQALYDAAQSYTLTIDGWERYSFNETKRWATDLYAPYKVSADDETIIRQHTEWIPVVVEP